LFSFTRPYIFHRIFLLKWAHLTHCGQVIFRLFLS
jgi:hypothetical protein